LYMVLPIVSMLVVFGGTIIELWMGPHYSNGWIPALLAIGFFIPISQAPAMRILVGLNAHGRPGMADFLASICSAGLVLFMLAYLKLGLAGVAVAITTPLTLVYAIYQPFLVSRQLDIHVRSYLLSATLRPAILVLPFAICLIIAKVVFAASPWVGLVAGGTAGGLVLSILYWRYALPERIKDWISRGLRRALRATGFRTTADAALDN